MKGVLLTDGGGANRQKLTVRHCFPDYCWLDEEGWGVSSGVPHYHQAGPGSGRGDQEASCSGAQEPGDETEASPGGRWACARFIFMPNAGTLMAVTASFTHSSCLHQWYFWILFVQTLFDSFKLSLSAQMSPRTVGNNEPTVEHLFWVWHTTLYDCKMSIKSLHKTEQLFFLAAADVEFYKSLHLCCILSQLSFIFVFRQNIVSVFSLFSNRCPVHLGQLLWVCEEGQLFSWIRLYTGTLHGPGKDSAGGHIHISTPNVLVWFDLSWQTNTPSILK